MDDDELMTIGRFARLSGLPVGTLRHYDEVGLLPPAVVDPESGYRRYRRDQTARARQIARLRGNDLPLEEIRQVLDDPDGTVRRDVLTRHRRRLGRQQELLTAQVRDADRFLQEGITMPALQVGCRPCQLKIAVTDVDAAVAFYVAAFGFRYDITRRTDQADHSAFIVGEYGQGSFFLLHLIDGQDRMDLPGRSTFGLLVEDLDVYHGRALEAGATEVVAPREAQGMPRNSAVRDPSGNWIWLYQG